MIREREQIAQRVHALRAELPPGSEIVPFASVRARDRAEVRSGHVFDLGLASNAFADSRFGDFVNLRFVRLFSLRGMLSSTSLMRLNPHLPGKPVPVIELGDRRFQPRGPSSVVVVDEIGEYALALCLGKTKPPSLAAVLTPTRVGRNVDALNRALGISSGVLAPELAVGEPAVPFEVMATTARAFISGPELRESKPAGLLFLGGLDLAEARARWRIAEELLEEAR